MGSQPTLSSISFGRFFMENLKEDFKSFISSSDINGMENEVISPLSQIANGIKNRKKRREKDLNIMKKVKDRKREKRKKMIKTIKWYGCNTCEVGVIPEFVFRTFFKDSK